MVTSTQPWRILLDHMPALPLTRRANIVLLEHDLHHELTDKGELSVTGSLVASVFGQRLVLRPAAAGTEGDPGSGALVFEGGLAEPLLHHAESASLSIPRLSLTVEQRDGGLFFDVSGAAGASRLRGLAALGEGSLLLEGDLSTAGAELDGDRYIRLDFARRP